MEQYKKYDYDLARTLTLFTGIIFFSQFLIEVSGTIVRQEGYEWIVPVTGILFLISMLYSLTLIVLNALNRKKEHD